MTALLVSKEHYTLKEARVIAKEHKISTKCRTLLIGINLYFCFGNIPTEETLYNINFIENQKYFLISQ